MLPYAAVLPVRHAEGWLGLGLRGLAHWVCLNALCVGWCGVYMGSLQVQQ